MGKAERGRNCPVLGNVMRLAVQMVELKVLDVGD